LCFTNFEGYLVDQATAIIIAAVITLSGSVTAAIIAARWKSRSEPQRHIYEYRLSYPMADEREAWIRSNSPLARIIRAVCWVVTTALIFFGTTALFWAGVLAVGWPVFGGQELPHLKLVVIALLPSGVLALIVAY
jgi:hypothetical protein